VLGDDGYGRSPLVGDLPSHYVEEGGSEGVDVGAAVEGLVRPGLLGAHVVGRPYHHAGHGEGVVFDHAL
jgi:hypothetical protein